MADQAPQTTEQKPVDPYDAALAAMDRSLFGEPQPEQTQEPAPEQTEETTTEDAADGATPAEEFVEIAADDGETYKVPPKLKDAFMRRDDYTKKTQEVASMRKQATLQWEALQAQNQFEQMISAERMQLAQISGELARYQNVDWANLDTDTLVKIRHQRDELRDKGSQIQNAILGKQKQFEDWRGQQKQKLLQVGLEHLRTAIPDWGEKHAVAATEQAKAAGYTDEEVQNVFDPRFVKLAWKASQYDKLMANKGSALEKASKAPPVIKPGSSDPQMSAKARELNWHKAMKNAPDTKTKQRLAEEKMAKFFGS